MPIAGNTRVTSVSSESDEVESTWTIVVSRDSNAQSPNVADLPDDVGRALTGWLLANYPQRVVMGAPAPRCQSVSPDGHECTGKLGHVGKFHGTSTYGGASWD